MFRAARCLHRLKLADDPVCYLRTFATQRQPTHYETLGLRPSSDKNLVKKQYYKLSKQFHPDLNPGNEEAHKRFVRIGEAYAVLNNDATRQEYDRHLAVNQTMGGAKHTYYHSQRTRPRQTGSASAYEQYREHFRRNETKKRRGKVEYNFKEHFERHYAEEDRRRKAREEAALRAEQEWKRAEDLDKPWNRFFKIAGTVVGILFVSGAASGTL